MKNVNDYGNLEISKAAFDDMANIAAAKIKGIYPAKKNGISDCSVKDGDLIINLNIKVKSGNDINKISTKLQNKVHEIIEEMTGIDCKNINVNILGFIQ
ncbi:MAG: Asp23/Gls24 family envelope stress response protein [Erysipelotrichaceae bacterium]|nr:Asp23/Gls24 family envelope stress response protein [Erysipelotrichaceae bacterium]